jgi:hypothetical protein
MIFRLNMSILVLLDQKNLKYLSIEAGLVYDCMEWFKGIHIATPTSLELRRGCCCLDQLTVNSIPRSMKKSK